MGVPPGEKRYIVNELGVGYRMLQKMKDKICRKGYRRLIYQKDDQ